jgi:hypothetical protein
MLCVSCIPAGSLVGSPRVFRCQNCLTVAITISPVAKVPQVKVKKIKFNGRSLCESCIYNIPDLRGVVRLLH